MLASGLFDSDICLTPVSRDANVGIRALANDKHVGNAFHFLCEHPYAGEDTSNSMHVRGKDRS